jgi:heme exporter protein A
MQGNRLELDGLAIARDGALLAPPIHCRLEGGELLAIEGPNGSGKSTLLRCVAGLLPPATGEIRLNGKPLGDWERGTVLYFGHRLGLSLALSVEENVAFWARAYHQPELIGAALHYFDLDDIADVPVRTLSAGWRQRVALTRLITVPGTIWLLDEPLAHLDQEGMRLLQSLLETRLSQGGMVLLASHIPLQGERIRRLHLHTPEEDEVRAYA